MGITVIVITIWSRCAAGKEDRGLTFVSGYGASCLKEPVEGSLRVLSGQERDSQH